MPILCRLEDPGNVPASLEAPCRGDYDDAHRALALSAILQLLVAHNSPGSEQSGDIQAIERITRLAQDPRSVLTLFGTLDVVSQRLQAFVL